MILKCQLHKVNKIQNKHLMNQNNHKWNHYKHKIHYIPVL